MNQPRPVPIRTPPVNLTGIEQLKQAEELALKRLQNNTNPDHVLDLLNYYNKAKKNVEDFYNRTNGVKPRCWAYSGVEEGEGAVLLMTKIAVITDKMATAKTFIQKAPLINEYKKLTNIYNIIAGFIAYDESYSG
jgi:hypothetical protein